MISIHVPREGHDGSSKRRQQRGGYFNPRAPRGARHAFVPDIFVYVNISIHVPREGHDATNAANSAAAAISIHVPREGHDQARAAYR